MLRDGFTANPPHIAPDARALGGARSRETGKDKGKDEGEDTPASPSSLNRSHPACRTLALPRFPIRPMAP